MPTIFYVTHSISEPRGGIRVLFRHVEHLRSAGFDARILHFGASLDIRWFEVKVPVHGADNPALPGEADWVVIPEDYLAALRAFKARPCRRMVFCQGHYNIFKALPVEESWREYGVEVVMGCSRAICDFVQQVFGYDAQHVPNGLELSRYTPSSSKELRIAFMPRKGPANLQIARGVLWHRRPDLRDVPWVALQGLDEAGVATELNRSAVFVATGYQEGLGMPPLEAMAAGALVVGFDGGGGAEYARPSNGFWVPNEDPLALAAELARAIDALRAQDPDATARRQAAAATASRYSLERQRQALIACWTRCLSAA